MDDFKDETEDFDKTIRTRVEIAKKESSDSYDEEEILETIKSINEYFPAFDYVAIVKQSLELLLKKDEDGINFFIDFFHIEDPNFLLNLDTESLFPFLAETFFQQEDEVLSLHAIKVICILVEDYTIDSSFFETPEFLVSYLKLFIHPNKEFAVIAATILYIILNRVTIEDTKKSMWQLLFQNGLITQIFSLMSNLSMNSDDEEQNAVYRKCAICASSFADILPIMNTDLNLCVDYIGFLLSLQTTYSTSQALVLLKRLILANKLPHIQEGVIDIAINEGIAYPEMLSIVFEFFDAVQRRSVFEDLHSYLEKKNFYNQLIEMIEFNNTENVKIITFLFAFDIFPTVNDEFMHRLFSLIENAHYNERIQLLDQLMNFINEKPDQAYPVLIEANIIEIIAEMFDSIPLDDPKIVCLQIVNKVLNWCIEYGIDIHGIDGIDTLIDDLNEIPEDSSPTLLFFSTAILSILIGDPNETPPGSE